MSAGAESARDSTAGQAEQSFPSGGSWLPYSESKRRLPWVMSRYVCSTGTDPSPALNNPGESPNPASC